MEEADSELNIENKPQKCETSLSFLLCLQHSFCIQDSARRANFAMAWESEAERSSTRSLLHVPLYLSLNPNPSGTKCLGAESYTS